ncbi:hypothetical protein KC571_03950, partial [candidate division WWE3 bacterium]|nr:hypothetical protein [candidate division WWE3 bacterium]
YVPVSSDAVQGRDVVHTHVQQYKQLLRWGWGIITFPMAIKSLLNAKKISHTERAIWFYRFFERYAIWYTIIILITFGFPLLILFNPEFRTTTFSFLLPKITSNFLTLALFLLIPAAWFRQKLTPPMPKDWPAWKRSLVILEGVLVILHLFTYVFLPFLQAETLFMFGRKMDKFEFTPKFRNEKKSKS